jgi:hypothetical protein
MDETPATKRLGDRIAMVGLIIITASFVAWL